MKDADVNADYAFFYSYLQPKSPADSPQGHAWNNAEELVKVNKALWSNFLEALLMTKSKPKRLMLQMGAKHYAVHIGRHRSPAIESDPPSSHLKPNFYYPQYEILFEYCDIGWDVISPAWIIGAVATAHINGRNPFAVYAAVQAHKGESLEFPSSWEICEDERKHATARLTGYLTEWAVLEEKCKNQQFNAQDTAPLSWEGFFGELARWFGAKGVIGPKDDDSKYQRIVGKAGMDTPLGYGPPTVYKVLCSFVKLAKEPENKAAWEEMMVASNGQLTSNPFEDPEENFQMGDGCLIPMAALNMNKARRMGWTGYVDTIESIFEMYEENAKLGLLPEMVVSEPRPMV